MKNQVYIRCPRCELNYILKRDKYCNVCKIEMKAQGTLGIDENLDLELCPVCKVNFINSDEDMCVACAKEKALEEGLAHDVDNSSDWDEGFAREDEGVYSEDEEAGEMVSITDLDDSPLDSEDALNIGFDDEEDADDIKVDDEDEEVFDDLDDDVFDDLDDEELELDDDFDDDED